MASNYPSANPAPSLQRALDGYRQIVELLSATRAPQFPDPGVTMAQMRVLMLLSVSGEARMSILASQLGISLSTLSSVVDRLVEAGYVGRRDDPTDRRGVLVSLTTDGVAMLDAFQELGVKHLRLLIEQLPPDEVEMVARTVEILVGAARRLTQEGAR